MKVMKVKPDTNPVTGPDSCLGIVTEEGTSVTRSLA